MLNVLHFDHFILRVYNLQCILMFAHVSPIAIGTPAIYWQTISVTLCSNQKEYRQLISCWLTTLEIRVLIAHYFNSYPSSQLAILAIEMNGIYKHTNVNSSIYISFDIMELSFSMHNIYRNYIFKWKIKKRIITIALFVQKTYR